MKSLFIAFLSLLMYLQVTAQPALPSAPSVAGPTRFVSSALTTMSQPTNAVITWPLVTNAVLYEVLSATNVMGPWLVSYQTTNANVLRVPIDLPQRYFRLRTSLRTNVSVAVSWVPPAGIYNGYNVYYGGQSYVYTNRVQVLDATNVILSGFVSGETYYFNATTIDMFGMESNFDGETSVKIPHKVVPLFSTISSQ